MYTGLRRGEALVLTRDDFDFGSATIRVSKSVYYDGTTTPKVKHPKTKAGARTIPILDPYATMLFECGLVVKDAQDLLGHSTAAMTQDTYTHLRNKRKKEIAAKLNEKPKELESK